MKERISFRRSLTGSSTRRSRSLFLLLAIFCGTLWNPPNLIFTDGAVQGQEQPEETKLDLESMTQEELEFICIERGFELIQDNTSGEALTHADYVDAARRCLAIEEDMNEILEQNPELAEELLSEIDRMKDEKEQLEQERQRMLAQKEELEQQLLEKAKTSATTNGGGSEGASVGRWGAGPTASSSPQPKQSASPVATSSMADTTEKDGEDDPFLEDTTVSSGNITAVAQEGRVDTGDDDDLCMPTSTEPTTKQSDPTPSSTTTETSSDSSAAATEDASQKTADFSLKSFLQEFVQEFERDVHRITTLMLPVVKPMLDAGNFAWKYVKVIFHGAKRQMEKYKSQQQQPEQQPKQSGETKESPLGAATTQ